MQEIDVSCPIIRNPNASDRDWERQITAGRQVSPGSSSLENGGNEMTENEWDEQMECNRRIATTSFSSDREQSNETAEMDGGEWDPTFDMGLDRETHFCKYLLRKSREIRRCSWIEMWRRISMWQRIVDLPNVSVIGLSRRSLHRDGKADQCPDEQRGNNTLHLDNVHSFNEF